MNFQQDVLDKSHDTPVVVDFWAPWCGPCRMLGPVLETLAREQEGRWVLCKINTEEYPDIASQYKVKSIPAVMLFHKGEVIDEFAGALPKASVERWLDKAIPDKTTGALSALLSLYSDWPDEAAIQVIDSFLAEHPGHKKGHLALARHQIGSNPSAVGEILAGIKMEDEEYDEAQHLLVLAEWMNADFGDVPAARVLNEAKAAFLNKDWDQTLRLVVEGVQIDKAFSHELPRRLAIALFFLLGAEHPMTRKYRRLFDMVLY